MENSLLAFFVLTFAVVVNIRAQIDNGLPNTFPQFYPNMPSGDYSPAWQTYFQVTAQLPNVTWDLPRNWAGNIPVQRTGHPNDTLFFWAFEKEVGSLTAGANERLNEPWGIWLNGGPGSSSMLGLLLENGPIRITNDYSAVTHNYSWDKIADFIWIDQPVGTGWSTADSTGYVSDEEEMGRDFFGFLENLVKVFPSLAKRPLCIAGESYAGVYIPYITKTYFGMTNPPVNIAQIAIGDGVLGSEEVSLELPTLTTIETFPQLIGYDKEVYLYFKEQEHLCGYDLNLTYPQNGHFPSFYTARSLGSASGFQSKPKSRLNAKFSVSELSSMIPRLASTLPKKRSEFQNQWKRDLRGRANGTVDRWYGCDLLTEMVDYAINFSFPWILGPPTREGFDVYNIPDALFPEAPQNASIFLNDIRTRSALHAPTSKNWAQSFQYPFGSVLGGLDPSVEPMAFLTELATNATINNVSIIIYSGNDDALVAHRGSEVVIQNTTFGGIQGFTRKPSTPWMDEAGNFAGVVHQERNWTYVLFLGAGHLVPAQKPVAAFTFLREFVLGNNETGLVTNLSGAVSVVGGESPALVGDYLRAGPEIYYGAGTTQSTNIAPTTTIAAWNSFIATAAPLGDIAILTSSAPSSLGSSSSNSISCGHRTATPAVAAYLFIYFMHLLVQ